jgi:hypothetical protein
MIKFVFRNDIEGVTSINNNDDILKKKFVSKIVDFEPIIKVDDDQHINDNNHDQHINDNNHDQHINNNNYDKNINDNNYDRHINDNNYDRHINDNNYDQNINDNNYDQNINDKQKKLIFSDVKIINNIKYNKRFDGQYKKSSTNRKIVGHCDTIYYGISIS